MANPVWPVALPQSAFVGQWSEVPGQANVEFSVEVGPPKRRRRISSAGRLIDHTIVLSTTQRAALLTFYEVTTKSGSLSFDWVHPIDGGTKVWRFEAEPSFNLLSGNKFQASLKLRIMP
jgi:hypothetical protein